MRYLKKFRVTTEVVYPYGTQTKRSCIKKVEVAKRPEGRTKEKRSSQKLRKGHVPRGREGVSIVGCCWEVTEKWGLKKCSCNLETWGYWWELLMHKPTILVCFWILWARNSNRAEWECLSLLHHVWDSSGKTWGLGMTSWLESGVLSLLIQEHIYCLGRGTERLGQLTPVTTRGLSL